MSPATVGATQTTWNWKLSTASAVGSAAVLLSPTSQFPNFIPDVQGTYVISETVANETLQVYAGAWQGEMTPTVQGVCRMCHSSITNIAPDIFPAWEGTAHFSALQRKIEGLAGPGFGPACLSCHVVGYDKLASADNDGFDDVEATSSWAFPAVLEQENWQTLLNTPSSVNSQASSARAATAHKPEA